MKSDDQGIRLVPIAWIKHPRWRCWLFYATAPSLMELSRTAYFSVATFGVEGSTINSVKTVVWTIPFFTCSLRLCANDVWSSFIDPAAREKPSRQKRLSILLHMTWTTVSTVAKLLTANKQCYASKATDPRAKTAKDSVYFPWHSNCSRRTSVKFWVAPLTNYGKPSSVVRFGYAFITSSPPTTILGHIHCRPKPNALDSVDWCPNKMMRTSTQGSHTFLWYKTNRLHECGKNLAEYPNKKSPNCKQHEIKHMV